MKGDGLTTKEIKLYRLFHFIGMTFTAGLVLFIYLFKEFEITTVFLLLAMIPILIGFAFGCALSWDVRIIPGLLDSEHDKS
jgi:hypothetical protein